MCGESGGLSVVATAEALAAATNDGDTPSRLPPWLPGADPDADALLPAAPTADDDAAAGVDALLRNFRMIFIVGVVCVSCLCGRFLRVRTHLTHVR